MQLTLDDLLQLIGAKEAELALLRRQHAEHVTTLQAQWNAQAQALHDRIATLEGQLAGRDEDAAVRASRAEDEPARPAQEMR